MVIKLWLEVYSNVVTSGWVVSSYFSASLLGLIQNQFFASLNYLLLCGDYKYYLSSFD